MAYKLIHQTTKKEVKIGDTVKWGDIQEDENLSSECGENIEAASSVRNSGPPVYFLKLLAVGAVAVLINVCRTSLPSWV